MVVGARSRTWVPLGGMVTSPLGPGTPPPSCPLPEEQPVSTATPSGLPLLSADRAVIFMHNFMWGSGVYGTQCTALDPQSS